VFKDGVYCPLPKCPDRPLIGLNQVIDCGLIEASERKSDAIHLAAEIGRLDVLSILIAVFAISITIATIIGFWFYRNVVDERAKKEAGELLPYIVKEHLAANPDLLVEAIRKNKEIFQAAFGVNSEKDFSDKIAETVGNNGK
jgi:hypothetical protein